MSCDKIVADVFCILITSDPVCPCKPTLDPKKISRSIALLRKAKDFASQEKLVAIYNSLVLPHFNYCSTIWNDNNKSHIDKLWKLQKRAARVITSSDYT